MEINVNVKVEKDITLNLLHKAVSHFVKQLDFLAKEDGYAFTIEDNNRMIANYKSKKFKGCSYDFIVEMEMQDKINARIEGMKTIISSFCEDYFNNKFTLDEKIRYFNGTVKEIEELKIKFVFKRFRNF
ncbi:MAG: hypothetical protein ACLSBH_00440 [Coprobacillus cateniformis]